MKQKLLLALFALLTTTMAWADVEINETNFPDENFRNWVLGQSYGKNAKLTNREIRSVTSIDVNGNNIKNLKGIEYFTALENLGCAGNQLTSLDVSKNTKLTGLGCTGNQLISLDVSGCSKLEYLVCNKNQLTSLDVSQNMKLTVLRCDSNQLTLLDTSYDTALKVLICSCNHLTSLDVSQNFFLSRLDCGNNQLTSLDLSQNSALQYLFCDNNQLTSLDMSKNTKLVNLYCYQNQIKGAAMDALVESLPNRVNGTLRVIYHKNEQNVMTTTQVGAAKAKGWIPYECLGINSKGYEEWREYALPGAMTAWPEVEINESNFPDTNFRSWVLGKSYGADGVLTYSEIAGITSIRVNEKCIQNLKGIEYFTELTRLYCANNQLTSLDISKNTKLTILWCDQNHLTSLDVSKNTMLTGLSCIGNQLTSLDVSQNIALEYLFCYKNQIKGAAMDALVESLPNRVNGTLRVIYHENEQNVMTTVQVAAVKAKGWEPNYYDGNDWKSYPGSEQGGATGE